MIYHITFPSEWEETKMKGYYEPEGFKIEGFIHFSTLAQVCLTAERYYNTFSDLLLMEVDETQDADKVKFENLMGGSELFPHYYDLLPIEKIKRVLSLHKDVENKIFNLPQELEI